MVLTLFTNLISLSRSFIKLYERRIDFVNNVTIALSNEEITKINFMDLEKLWNFVVKNFLIWIHLGLQNVLQKTTLPSVLFSTRQIASLPSARKKHSANHMALDKEPDSGSEIGSAEHNSFVQQWSFLKWPRIMQQDIKCWLLLCSKTLKYSKTLNLAIVLEFAEHTTFLQQDIEVLKWNFCAWVIIFDF
jgi:hypothetical protein